MKTVMITIACIGLAGCVTTPTSVRLTEPIATFSLAGSVATLKDCAALAIERDIGFETNQRKMPRGTDLAMWGALDRQTIAVVSLEDEKGAVRATVYKNPHVIIFPSVKSFALNVENSVRTCYHASPINSPIVIPQKNRATQ